MWRYTADLLFILQNPMIREAFFPTTEHLLLRRGRTARRLAGDRGAGGGQEAPASVAIWRRVAAHPDWFRVARSGDGASRAATWSASWTG
jgi:hypothetical protein